MFVNPIFPHFSSFVDAWLMIETFYNIVEPLNNVETPDQARWQQGQEGIFRTRTKCVAKILSFTSLAYFFIKS